MPIFLKDRKRNPWRGKVKRAGFKEEYAYFPTRDEAKEWEETRSGILRRKAKGLNVDIMDLSRITIGQMIDKYLKEETAHKASCQDETYRINIFKSWKDIKTRPLIAFTRPDAVEFRNYLERDYIWIGKPYERWGKLIIPKRKPKKLKPGSIRRMIAIFKDMWNIAAKDWKGYEALKDLGNPWAGVSSRQVPKKRTRRLDDLPSRLNELDRLLEASKKCQRINKIYTRLAINLAVQTGMRLQEILYLTWRDVDLKSNRITIRKSKTDYRSENEGRVIVIPLFAQLYLKQAMYALAFAPVSLKTSYSWRPDNKVFQTNKSAFKQVWAHLVERAGIASKEDDAKAGIRESQCGLEFKDLRREAGSRFDEAGLTKAEHDLMMGHESKDIAGIYIAPYLDRIEKKLDAYWMENKNLLDPTTREALDKGLNIVEIMSISTLEMSGFDLLSKITGTGFELTKDGQIINKETKEPIQIPEAVSNVIPFLRKHASKSV